MTEQKLLIELLRQVVCNDEIQAHRDLSEDQLRSLYKFAKFQDLAHIVGAAFQDQFSEDQAKIKEVFAQAQMRAVYRSVNMTYALQQIYEVFEKNAIRYMPLKGSIIRNFYPSPELRTSCDIDILVSTEDLDRAVNCLVSEVNYTLERRYSHDVSLFSPSKVHLELHFNLIESNEKAEGVLNNIWSAALPDSGSDFRYIMSNEYFVVYHIAHMAEHFVHGGCGIRNFLDLWIAKNKMGYDDALVERLLSECGLYEFATAVFQLSNVWFGNAEHNDITLEIENYVFGAGIYGTVENNVAISQSQTGGKVGYILKRLFLPYAKMKRYYPRLEKYPILFPFYQIVRWFDFAFNKNKSRTLLELKYNQNVDQDKKKRLQKMLDDLKLSF